MAIVKKKAAKKAVKRPNPFAQLDKQIVKAVSKGKNRLEKILMAVTIDQRTLDTRLRYLKRNGKLAYISKQGWHIPTESNASNNENVAPARQLSDADRYDQAS